jgi:CubicO group peptidase (beta-lactamase class C family)
VTNDFITAALTRGVDAGALAGAVALVWRDGTVRHAGGVGWRDAEASLPAQRDTIFRIASMSKPITCVAALMLYEQGHFALDDPITHWAPEFSTVRVLRSCEGPLHLTDRPERPITFRDLLTQRSGITYGAFHGEPLRSAYASALGGEVDSHVAPDAWIAALAALPLIAQPGSTFTYGHSTDLLGLIIARIANKPLGDVLAQLIFEPLGMHDTCFIVPRSKWDRRAVLYGFDDAGQLSRRSVATGGSTVPERPADMTYVSGGSGLWSTVDDYCAFARIFAGDGSIDGVRLLEASTLAMMTCNHLTPAQRASANIFGLPLFAAGHGYGMGVAVVMEPEHAPATLCAGGVGTVGWPGAWGGWWQADPVEGTVKVFLTHHLVEPHQWAQGIGLGVYAVITDFHALSSA